MKMGNINTGIYQEKVYLFLTKSKKQRVFDNWKEAIIKKQDLRYKEQLVSQMHNQFLLKTYFNNILDVIYQREQQFLAEQQRKRAEIAKAKRKQQYEVADRFYMIKQETMLKSCFEFLRLNKEYGKIMNKKADEFRHSMDDINKLKVLNCLKLNVKFKQTKRQIPIIQKKFMFKRFVNHVQSRIEKKKSFMAKYEGFFAEYNCSYQDIHQLMSLFREMKLLKNAFMSLKIHVAKIKYQREMIITADIFRTKKLLRRWRKAYLNINVAKESFEIATLKHSDIIKQNSLKKASKHSSFVDTQVEKANQKLMYHRNTNEKENYFHN